MRMILCQVDDLGETFTFSECNFTSQAPGPYNYATAPLYSHTPQATSTEGAKQLLGQIFEYPTIQSV